MDRYKLEEMRGKLFVILCIIVLIIMIFSIVYFVSSRGLATFLTNGVKLSDMFLKFKWDPEGEPPLFGAVPFIFGSFITSILAATIAAPLSLFVSIFISEISPTFGKNYLRPVIELLVGIPSVVYGFVGLSVIVPLLRDVFPGQGIGVAAGALVLSIMILPTITSITADALSALPPGLKESSYALGATRWQTISRMIVPTIFSALLTGVVLGIARAFGEALAVQMVIGNAPHIPTSLFESTSTLTSIITLDMGNTVMGSVHNNALWTLALVLMLMTFVFVFIMRLLGRRSVR